jgi:hypothetical protein
MALENANTHTAMRMVCSLLADTVMMSLGTMSRQKRHDTSRAYLKCVAAWQIGSDTSSIRVHLNSDY